MNIEAEFNIVERFNQPADRGNLSQFPEFKFALIKFRVIMPNSANDPIMLECSANGEGCKHIIPRVVIQ